MSRYFGPLALALLGLLIVLSGSTLQESVFGNTAAEARVGNVVATASATALAGFGVGSTTINVKTEKPGASGLETVRFNLSRGTIAPEALLLGQPSPSEPASAVLVSEGLGSADLLVQLTTPQKQTDEVLLKFAFRWPIALTAAAVGGALIGMALLLAVILRTEFRRPSIGVILAACGITAVYSMATVITYLIFVAPLITATYRYTPVLIMLLAAIGPFVVRQLVMKNNSRM